MEGQQPRPLIRSFMLKRRCSEPSRHLDRTTRRCDCRFALTAATGPQDDSCRNHLGGDCQNAAVHSRGLTDRPGRGYHRGRASERTKRPFCAWVSPFANETVVESRPFNHRPRRRYDYRGVAATGPS